jgi:hypothetical protein
MNILNMPKKLKQNEITGSMESLSKFLNKLQEKFFDCSKTTASIKTPGYLVFPDSWRNGKIAEFEEKLNKAIEPVFQEMRKQAAEELSICADSLKDSLDTELI